MRRRAADYRRPVRRRLSLWIWALLGMFLIAGLILFVFHHHHHEDQIKQPIQENHARAEPVNHEGLNFTKELLSATSFSRQLAEQMMLAKAYVIIAKEHNNLYLAWELSKKIRSCQLLLSKAAMRGEPITLEEAEPIISGLSYLIFKAQDAHYDVATTIMTMKSHIQALEERANAATVQSAVFGQLAAEALPKSLHCLKVKLTTDWLKKLPLQDLAEEKRNSQRVVDNNLYHFCIFSDNMLATSVVINSSICNADHPKQLVFHIVTNEISYGAMQAWFLGNDFKGATIEVQNVEEFSWLNASYAPVVKQLLDEDSRSYYFSGYSDLKTDPKLRNPKRISHNFFHWICMEMSMELSKLVLKHTIVITSISISQTQLSAQSLTHRHVDGHLV
ncbi:hexosyltransferase GAUT11 isoform X2 [Jatropha curcas]|uniref:hexosyltransferase GAUT11 isoform X2 n=1 Tax=Jatropha curcas TaxID=180498 RepID=UPI0005FB966D|nr:hexosyltransferase GAUT11 isoform X2 [Jatropha curcas]